jgi:hypothetical protein
MKTTFAALFTLCFVACGARETAEAPASVTTASVAAAEAAVPSQAFTDEQLGLPPYPGATERPNSRFRAQTAQGETLTVFSITSDSPTQVTAFYRVEMAKLGTVDEGISSGERLMSISVQRNDGSMSGMQAARGENEQTVISLLRLTPKPKS